MTALLWTVSKIAFKRRKSRQLRRERREWQQPVETMGGIGATDAKTRR